MRRLLLPLLALLLLALPALGAGDGVRVAVLYFENEGNPELDMLRLGLSQMLITQLAGQPGLTVMERGRINEVLGELELQKTSAVDPETAVKLGELLGVDRLVLGGYLEAAGQFVLTGRVVDVQTGEVVGGSLRSGVVSEFVPMLSAMSGELLPVLQAAPQLGEGGAPGGATPASEQTTYDFDDDVVEGELVAPAEDALGASRRADVVEAEEEAPKASRSSGASKKSRSSRAPKTSRRGSSRASRPGGGGGSRGPAASVEAAPEPAPAPAPAVPGAFAGAMALSMALDLLDRGDAGAARKELARALQLDPSLDEAQLQLERLDAVIVE